MFKAQIYLTGKISKSSIPKRRRW